MVQVQLSVNPGSLSLKVDEYFHMVVELIDVLNREGICNFFLKTVYSSIYGLPMSSIFC